MIKSGYEDSTSGLCERQILFSQLKGCYAYGVMMYVLATWCILVMIFFGSQISRKIWAYAWVYMYSCIDYCFIREFPSLAVFMHKNISFWQWIETCWNWVLQNNRKIPAKYKFLTRKKEVRLLIPYNNLTLPVLFFFPHRYIRQVIKEHRIKKQNQWMWRFSLI